MKNKFEEDLTDRESIDRINHYIKLGSHWIIPSVTNGGTRLQNLIRDNFYNNNLLLEDWTEVWCPYPTTIKIILAKRSRMSTDEFCKLANVPPGSLKSKYGFLVAPDSPEWFFSWIFATFDKAMREYPRASAN